MNDTQNPETVTETGEEVQLTDAQISQFIDAGGQAPEYHTILEVWREILKHSRNELTAHVNAGWASKIVSSWPEITYASMEAYRDIYFGLLIEALEILEAEIASDADCLSYTTPADDAEENAHHYKNLILQWNMMFQQAELDWVCTMENAGCWVAAISEGNKAIFGPTGVTQYLDNIGFEFGESDQADLQAALVEQRGER